MKKNLFKILILMLGVLFTVGCEMTLSFNDYNDAVKSRDALKTTSNTTNSNGGSDNSNTQNTQSSSRTTISYDNLYTRPTTTTIPITRNEFTVTLNGPMFNEPYRFTVLRYTNANIPEAFQSGVTFVRDGVTYKIVGYYLDPGYNQEFDLTSYIEDDLNLYAKVEVTVPEEDQVTVTFVSNGGQAVEALVVDKGFQLVSASIPSITKEKANNKTFIFAGWFYDSAFTSKVNEGDEITQSINIYAKWREVIRDGLFEYTESTDFQSYEITAYLPKNGQVAELDILTIPTSYNGRPVTSVGNFDFISDVIKEFVVPEGITGFYASFSRMTNLRKLTFASTIKNQFRTYSMIMNCYQLVEVYNLTNNDLTVSNVSSQPSSFSEVFAIHTSLSEPSIIVETNDYVYAPDKNGQLHLLEYKKPIPSDGILLLEDDLGVTGASGYHIGGYCFYKTDGLKKVVIDKAIKSVQQGAFQFCKDLETIEIFGAPLIRSYAFYDLDKLDIVYATSLERTYEQSAFYASYSSKFYFDGYNLLDWIQTQHFAGGSANPIGKTYGCEFYLHDETNGTEVYRIKETSNLKFKRVTEIILEDSWSLTEIPQYQFMGFKDITKLRIPNTVTKIGQSAFGYSGLEEYNRNNKLYVESNNGKYYGNETNPYLIYLGQVTSTYYSDTQFHTTVININNGTKFIYENSIYANGRVDPSSPDIYNNPHYLDEFAIDLPDTVIQVMKNSIFVDQGYVKIRFGAGVSYLEEYTIRNDTHLYLFIANMDFDMDQWAITRGRPGFEYFYIEGNKEQTAAIQARLQERGY
ncbi:MAG: leucine-rich repeat protein, partial [Gammaproteobacteria bacterium]|nr:leucine-rich repeat protein [Gammaproteobacteria bacterium]